MIRASIASTLFVLFCFACSTEAPAGSAEPQVKEGKPQKDGGTADQGKADGGDEKPKDPTIPPEDEDYLWPPQIFAGFTTGAEFKVPVATNLTGADVKFTADDPSLFDIAPAQLKEPNPKFVETFAMLTMKKAGKTTLKVTKGTKTVSSEVTVVAYTPEQLAAGRARYKTGGTEANRVACASCHEKPDGWDHSPTMIAAYDDANTLSAIQTAVYADGFELKLTTHKWNLTDPEKTGVMAYLRSLTPKGF